MNDYGIITQQPNEELQRRLIDTADAVEFTTKTQGWNFVSDFIENKKKRFAERILSNELSDLTNIAYERGVIQGLLELVAEIESTIEQRERLTK